MVKRFPLLDGSEIDLDETLDSHPPSNHSRNIVLRNDYIREQLEWWETYQTDSGPTSPSISGLATSGGDTRITLDTGAASAGDLTAVVGPTVNWSNWTEIRAYIWGMRSDGSGGHKHLFSLSATPDYMSDGDANPAGFAVGIHEWNGGRFNARVDTDSANQQSGSYSDITGSSEYSAGFRIYNNETSAGYSVDFTLNGEYLIGHPEQGGWPASQDLTFYHLVKSMDGSDHTAVADGWLIELIP